jgi:hypothetical protein
VFKIETLLLISSVQNQTKKRISFSSNSDPYNVVPVRQRSERRQKRESYIGQDVYIGRPSGHLPDVVCCQLVVCM